MQAAPVVPAAFDCDPKQAGLGQGDFLTQLRFAPVTPQQGDPLVLRTASVWQNAERVRFGFADGSEEVLAFTAADASRFLTVGAIMEFPVPFRTVALETVTIETYGSPNLRGVVQGAEILPQSEAFRQKLLMTAIYAGFAGLAIALIAYNLSLWAALRSRFQLYYCNMVVWLSLYTFSSSGVLGIIMPSLSNNDRLRLNYVLLAMAGATALRFACKFFGEEVCGPRLTRAALGASVAAVGAGVVFATLAPWQINMLDRAYMVAMIGILAVTVPLLVCARRRRNRFFWLFILAWSAPIGVSALRAAHGFNLIGYSIWLDNGNLVAMAIEALLSSFLVMARLRQLSEERDNARANEKSARKLAATDPLTGLLNRRAFLDLAIGRRSQQRLMLIDIDNFKAVNDKAGHEAGDKVLLAIAEAIERVRPARSLVVRLGGEEFGLLMPRTEADICNPDDLLEAVRSTTMPHDLKVTVSIGYSDGRAASEDDWNRLYRLADAALYRAKADGRDRACRATDFSAAA